VQLSIYPFLLFAVNRNLLGPIGRFSGARPAGQSDFALDVGIDMLDGFAVIGDGHNNCLAMVYPETYIIFLIGFHSYSPFRSNFKIRIKDIFHRQLICQFYHRA
jgi:hypothetical protein